MNPTISIIGATITGNRGAEAMAETVIAKLRERHANARFNLFSYYPREDAAVVSDEQVRIFSSTPLQLVALLFPFALIGWLLRKFGLKQPPHFFPKSVKALWASDMLVDLAGVSFVDGREKFLPFNILTIWPAMLLGVPVVKLSQAVGGFDGALNRAAAGIFLGQCEKVFARGGVTESHLNKLGLNGSAGRADDVAFLYQPTFSLGETTGAYAHSLLTQVKTLKSQTRILVGVCPSSVIRQKVTWDYPDFLARLIEDQASQGAGVVLFPNATRANAGDALRNNDLPVIRDVMTRLSPKVAANVIAVDQDIDAAGIKKLIDALDVAVVSRFHAMVGALSQSVPVLVIGWSHKYLEVMSLFGQENRVFDYDRADFKALKIELDALVRERMRVSKTLKAHLAPVRASAESQFDYLNDRLAPQ